MHSCVHVGGGEVKWRGKGRLGQVDPSMTRSHKLATGWTNKQAEANKIYNDLEEKH